MTTTLKFKSKDVKRCVKHALKSNDHSMAYGYEGKPRAALFLVKDDGIYMMSNGNPRDLIGKSERSFVAYATGFDPRKADVYSKCVSAVGGDDFSETVLIDGPLFDEIVLHGADLHVGFSEDEFSVATKRPANKSDAAIIEYLAQDEPA